MPKTVFGTHLDSNRYNWITSNDFKIGRFLTYFVDTELIDIENCTFLYTL